MYLFLFMLIKIRYLFPFWAIFNQPKNGKDISNFCLISNIPLLHALYDRFITKWDFKKLKRLNIKPIYHINVLLAQNWKIFNRFS